MMNKGIALFGASVVALGALCGSAEAKKVSYEIDGQRYWYSTNNRKQVEEARQRMAGANAAAAAAAAKAKADAELAANPLVGIFGSQAQREASQARARAQAETQAQAQGLVPLPAQATVDTTSSIPSASAPSTLAVGGGTRDETRAERARPRREARAGHGRRWSSTQAGTAHRRTADRVHPERKRVVRAERIERRKTLAEGAATRPAKAERAEAAAAVQDAANSAPSLVAQPAARQEPPKAAVKTLSFDLGSGVKRTEMTDGTVRAEPFDSSTVWKLRSTEPAASSLAGFVDQVRKAPPNGQARPDGPSGPPAPVASAQPKN